MSRVPKPIPLPVTAVTCLEDRAHVERSTVLDLEAGVQRLRLGPVSALAVDRTLHAELTGEHPATVLDVRIVRSWTPRGPLPSAEDDSVLRHRVHALQEERTALERRRDRLLTRQGLLDRLAADLLREIGEGAGSGESELSRWSGELDRVDEERDTHGERLRAVETRLAALAVELGEIRRAVQLSEEEPTELVGHVELTVEAAAAGPVGLRLGHLTPCALWRPSYRAVLEGDALTLETDAVVWQRTGEDWSDVRLTLSTARSALAGDPPRLGEDVLTLKDRSAAERRTVDVELREEEIGDLGPAAVLGLPGVDDGGEARVLSSPVPVSVPGDGRAHRVPLSVFTAPASSEYACSPELSPLVTQVVRFDNLSGHA
ncbi:mucoidy inhibitor MuiA family protein, partial [Streptomyces sp. NPDC059233]